MMHLLLLALAAALACGAPLNCDQLSGKWHTLALAASNVDKIEDGGDLQIDVRSIECIDGGKKMSFRFYVNHGEECEEFTRLGTKQGDSNVYTGDYAGQNKLEIVSVKEESVVFYNVNVDEKGRETRALGLVGRRPSLTPEEQEEFVQTVRDSAIPEENIRYLSDSDTCPY